MRMTIELDDKLVADVQKTFQSKTRTTAIETALREAVREQRKKRLLERKGSGALDMTLEELLAARKTD